MIDAPSASGHAGRMLASRRLVGDGGEITGIGSSDAGPEAVARIMAADPRVQAGVFTYDISPTRCVPGRILPAPA